MNKVDFPYFGVSTEVKSGTTLLDAIRQAGVPIDSPCDGAGTCGKCRVQVGPDHGLDEDPHDFLTESERAAGFVIACQSILRDHLRVEMRPETEVEGLKILSDGHERVVEINPWIQKQSSHGSTRILAGGEEIGAEPGDTTLQLYGLAVDIGTTTLVSALVDLRDGRQIATSSSLNPQARHAQDVLSRIKIGSQPDGLNLLRGELIQELNGHIAELSREEGIESHHIYEAIFSGNTTMLYLAVGADPTLLGKYPYPLTLKGGEQVRAAEIGLRISPHGLIYLPPLMSAYVGADISSGILACQLAQQEGVVLFVDIGTNGEMVLGVNHRLTATSTAAGPAFEGMNITCGMRAGNGAVERVALGEKGVEIQVIGNTDPIGLCGSGLLDVVGQLAAHGGVDQNGRFQLKNSEQPWKLNWETVNEKPVFRIAGPVYLQQKDVRQVQLAKAAIRTGIELMLKANHLSAAEVDQVLIAGSFGFHLRTESLIHLGLLPPEFEGRVQFVGNTSRTGAQALLLNYPIRQELQRITQEVQVLELSKDPDFQKLFLKSIQFTNQPQKENR